MKHKKGLVTLICLIFALILCFIISFFIGNYNVSIRDVFASLLPFLFSSPVEETVHLVVVGIRLPRILLAILVGAALSVAGATYQGVFQNPLVSPDILGSSSAASLGAAIAIMIGGRTVFLFSLVLSLAVVFLVYTIASRAGGMKTINLILSGMMISAVCTSLLSYIKLIADSSVKLPQITYWLMGSFADATIDDVLIFLIPFVVGMLPLLLLRWRINLLSLGEESALALGVNVKVLRAILIFAATLLTSSSVAMCGVIGFVGLVVPHLMRRIVGSDYAYLLPSSMVFGSLFMLVIDNIARSALSTEIPIGILTSLIGAPFFIYLIVKRGNRVWA